MMQRLSNSLTDLADRINIAAQESALAEVTSAAKAIEAGTLLIEAKQLCRHGEWLPFLERAGTPERKAQRYMRLARTGLNPTAVSDLGGIKAALEWAEGLRLPSEGELLFIWIDLDSHEQEPVAIISHNGVGHLFFIIDLRGYPETWQEILGMSDDALTRYIRAVKERPFICSLTKPIIKPEHVLPSVYSMLEHRYGEMSFSFYNSSEANKLAELVRLAEAA
jgi:hypothetical protein